MAVSGVSSSDLDSMLYSYRSSISKPVTTLETKQTSLQSRVTALTELKTKLTSLQTTVNNLAKTGSESVLNAFEVSSSDSSVVTASATATALEGSHTLKINQIAKSDTVVTNRLTNSATTITDSEGTGVKTFGITVNGTTTNISITIEAGDTNDKVLTKISTAVNYANIGVTASSVADTTSTKKLMLVSKSTGSSQAISMQNVTGTLLDDLGLTAAVLSGRTKSTSTTAGYSNTDAGALNSLFTLDGIDFERETNSVTDVLSGVTLDLKGSQTADDSEITLTIAANKSAITDKIKEFITNYNAVLTYLNQKTGIDSDTKTRQVLAGDSTITGLKYDLRNIVSGVISGIAGGNPHIISDIGISIARDGSLTLNDPDLLEEKLSSVSAVANVFNSTNGIATRMKATLKSMLTYGSGQIEIVSKSTRDQISSLKDRIAHQNKRIDVQVERYKNQFLQLQSVYNQISIQQQTISSILSAYSY